MTYDSFNYVDNLLIAYMSYTPLDEAFKSRESYTVEDLNHFLTANSNIELMAPNSLVSSAPIVLEAMAKSRRFKNSKIYNYESILHEDTSEQFAAFMMDLEDSTTVVCFRGTDDTLIGWHEDFMMSYTETAAQKDAAEYLNKHSKLFKKYRIIGHSKGGNLALYAAVHCGKSARNRIVQVVSNDGPGLRPDSYPKEAFDELSDRYVKIVPEFSLFGIIFDNAKNKLVVKSSGSGIMQHSAPTWQCTRNQFDTVDDICRTSQLLKEGIDKFMSETKAEERKITIQQLYDSLKEANIQSITDFASGGIPVVLKALKSITVIDDKVKDTLGKLIKIFTDAYTTELSETVASGTEMIRDKAKKVSKNVESFVSDTVKNVEGMISNKNKKIE